MRRLSNALVIYRIQEQEHTWLCVGESESITTLVGEEVGCDKRNYEQTHQHDKCREA